MKNVLSSFLSICLLACLGIVPTSAQQTFLHHYSVEDGLASATIYDIMQDNRGFIWLGTEAGVSRFDGISFRNFSKSDGLADSEVFTIFQDSKRRIWFLPFNGRLSFEFEGHFSNPRNLEALSTLKVASLFNSPFEDEEGQLWIGTQKDGIVLIGEDIWKHLPFSEGEKSQSVDVIGVRNDTLICRSGQSELIYLIDNVEPPSLHLIDSKEGEEAEDDIAIVLDHPIKKVFTSDNGTIEWYLTSTGQLFERSLIDESISLLLSNSNVTDVFQDNESNVWISTLEDGLYMKTSSSSEYYNADHGLSQNQITSFWINDIGECLAGHNSGSYDVFSFGISNSQKLSDHSYNRVLDICSRNDTDYFATDKGLFYKSNADSNIYGPALSATKCLFKAENENIYLGNYAGLYVLDPSFNNGYEKLYGGRTTAISEDEKGNILFGGNDGVRKFMGDRSVIDIGPRELRVRSITSLSDIIIIGTHGEGLILLQNDSTYNIALEQGLSSTICQVICRENDSVLWIGTNNGLNRLELRTDVSHPVISVFNTENGLLSNYVNDLFYDNGHIWVATNMGISVLRTNIPETEEAPPVYLTGFKINDRDTTWIDGLELDHDQNKVQIGFTGISLASGTNTKFRYMLQGADKHWTIGSSREVLYQSLAPGNYIFKVKAVSANGQQSEKAVQLSFKILRPVWKRWWFQLGASLLGIALLLIAVRMVYKYNQRKELESKNRIIAAEKERSDELLLNILPAATAEELKEKGYAEARSHEQVTIFFSDFKGFTRIAEHMSPEELVGELHTCFKAFDEIIEKNGLEKIKTIGDAYMCAGGLNEEGNGSPAQVINAALDIQAFMHEHARERRELNSPFFEARIGIHTGHVVAGVVGIKKFAYDIWGDAVNTAARMETSGEIGKINISDTTYELIKDSFDCQHRGRIQAKNKGQIDMYFVIGKKA